MTGPVVPWAETSTGHSPGKLPADSSNPRALTVRMEYGGMRFENDGAAGQSGAILARMIERHELAPVTMNGDGTGRSRTMLTGQRVTVRLIAHEPLTDADRGVWRIG